MDRTTVGDLLAFLAVARERSFTRAAAQLSISPSALSHTVSGLESRLGLRLLTRTTRSVAPTATGERLLSGVGPLLDDVDKELVALTALRSKPAGKLRITTVEHVGETILWPAIRKLLARYPDIEVEISADYSLTDIVAQRFDAGVRLGEQVAPGMIAMRISPDLRMVVVGAPAYFKRNAPPKSPRELVQHRCINLRLPTHGGLLTWNFRKGQRELNVKVEAALIFNTLSPMIQAALDGFGLLYTVSDTVQSHIDSGQLVPVLEDWSATVPGYHLYYPSRRHHSPAFALLIDALRLPTAQVSLKRQARRDAGGSISR